MKTSETHSESLTRLPPEEIFTVKQEGKAETQPSHRPGSWHTASPSNRSPCSLFREEWRVRTTHWTINLHRCLWGTDFLTCPFLGAERPGHPFRPHRAEAALKLHEGTSEGRRPRPVPAARAEGGPALGSSLGRPTRPARSVRAWGFWLPSEGLASGSLTFSTTASSGSLALSRLWRTEWTRCLRRTRPCWGSPGEVPTAEAAEAGGRLRGPLFRPVGASAGPSFGRAPLSAGPAAGKVSSAEASGSRYLRSRCSGWACGGPCLCPPPPPVKKEKVASF